MKRRNYGVSFTVMIVLLLALMLLSICMGSVSVSPQDVFSVLSGSSTEGTSYDIVWNLRLPRMIAAVLLGGALSVSGFLLQVFFHNPIAGPYILGISSGAKLVVAITMIFFAAHGIAMHSVTMVLAALVGSMLATGFVLLISMRVPRASMLIVCGIMIGYICSAVTDLAVTFADDSNIVNLHNWSQGSFSGIKWDNIAVMTGIVLVTLVVTFFLSKPIGACQMGENYARNMGVNVRALRFSMILLSSILSATATAFAGPISFVGVAVPHLMKMWTRTAKPIVLIPACFFGGALITLSCDILARCLFAPTEVAVSSVTAVLLAPIVIAMMVRRQEGNRG